MEYIDVLDENGIRTGKSLDRGEIHKKGLWHRAIVVAIVNEKNEILMQQRSANKEKNAGLWDISVAGHLSSGQDSLMAAAREINEEVSINLGQTILIKDFRFMYSFRKEQIFSENFIERQFYDFFVLRQDNLDISTITYQESEVQAIKFVNVSQLREMIDSGQVVPREEVYEELINYLFRY